VGECTVDLCDTHGSSSSELSLSLLSSSIPPHVHIQLQTAVGANLTKTSLVHAFASLLKDPEAEVRASACNRLKGTSQIVLHSTCHTFQGVSHTYI
jgi:hypothetical protein